MTYILSSWLLSVFLKYVSVTVTMFEIVQWGKVLDTCKQEYNIQSLLLCLYWVEILTLVWWDTVSIFTWDSTLFVTPAVKLSRPTWDEPKYVTPSSTSSQKPQLLFTYVVFFFSFYAYSYGLPMQGL